MSSASSGSRAAAAVDDRVADLAFLGFGIEKIVAGAGGFACPEDFVADMAGECRGKGREWPFCRHDVFMRSAIAVAPPLMPSAALHRFD